MSGSNVLARQQPAQQQLAQAKELTIDLVCEATGYTPVQLALIWRTVAADAPLLELAQFLHACKALQLDPLLRQAYWIRRKSRAQVDGEWQDVYKGTLQVGIDGFRSLADRQGNYAGSDPPEFRDLKEITFERWKYTDDGRRDGKETVKLVVPGLARIFTWKIVQGHKARFTGEARWDEFYPGAAQGQMWHKMPYHQLAKCAEGQSLRKGWPALLGTLNLDTAGVEESGPEGLPLAGVPSVQVEEQPVAAPRKGISPERYKQITEDNYGEDFAAAPPPQKQPDPDDDEPDGAVDEDKAQLLERNKQLLTGARGAGLRGLAPLTANTTWPPDKIDDANRELTTRLGVVQ